MSSNENEPNADMIFHENSDTILNFLIRNTHLTHILLDRDLVVKKWNSAAESLWSISEQDAAGQVITDILSFEDTGMNINEHMNLLLFKPQSVYDSSSHVDRDGKEVYCEWFFTSLVDRRGKVAGVSLVIQDISRWMSAQEELNEFHRQKYKSMFQKAPMGMFQATMDGEFVQANPFMGWLLGYESAENLMEEHVGMDQDFFLDDQKRRDFFFNILEAEQVSHFKARIQRKDGSQFWGMIHAQITVNASGRPNGFYGYLTDISVTVRAEEAMKRARDMAEEAARAKSDFLANMSHEIRTPLNAVIGFTDLVLKTDLDDRQRDYIRKVGVSGKALLGIINDILDFSKIEAGKMELETKPFSIFDLLNNLSDMFANTVMEKKIELIISASYGVPYALIGDFFHLTQILINLINNALKFTSEGEVVVWASLVEHMGKQVKIQFSVSDTGIGMTKKETQKLFTSFTQADTSTSRKYGGTGLGLSICKRLVELMGGKIWVKSEPDKGSTFAFTVVLDYQEDIKNPWDSIPDGITKLRFLIHDPNPATREVNMMVLSCFSLHAACVGTGKEVMDELERARIENRPYDLIFFNWQGGEQGVVHTIQSIRLWESKHQEQLKEHRRNLLGEKAPETMPLIMTMSFGQEEDRDRAIAAGATSFVVKPLRQTELVNTFLKGFNQEPVFTIDTDIDTSSLEVSDAVQRGLWILVVDDNEINREVAFETLVSQGFGVDLADNGENALAMIQNRQLEKDESGEWCYPYDLVLLDIQMPDMDGYQVARRVRAWEKEKGGGLTMPIIAMSAHAFSTEKELCLEAGMNDYVSKPFDPNMLFSKILQWASPKTGRPVTGMPVTEFREQRSFDIDLPDNLTGIDVASGLSKVAGNKQVYKKLLSSFYQKNKNLIQDIQSVLDDKNWDKAKEISHMIKGVSGNLGITGVYNASGLLEASLKKPQPENVKNLGDDFIDQLKTVMGVLEPLASEVHGIDERENDIHDDLDFRYVLELIDDVIGEVDEDLLKGKSDLEALRIHLEGSTYQDTVLEAEQKLEDYDTDGAKNELISLATLIQKNLSMEVSDVEEEDRQKILVVDDMTENITVLMELLKSDYRIIVAKDGEKAIAKAQTKYPPDLILLDINMPGISGFEVCRQLKDNEKTRDIPIIFITAESDVEDQAKGFELGAVDYITKPIVPVIVKMRVKTQIEIKSNRDKLSVLSTMDGLTGIPNRRRFDDILDREWHRCMRSNSFLSLILMDIDHFKQFNDNYGHQAGDDCLQKVAVALKKGCMRETDLLARYGGEEFVAVLPDTDYEGALIVADRMKKNLDYLNIPHAFSSTDNHITISQGLISMIPDKKMQLQEFIEASDRCLYQAKENGRNRVVPRLIKA